jgi:chromosome segregation ATPase
LTNFNGLFSTNIGNLDETFGKVNESYRLQTQLLDTVQQIADKDISRQNVKLHNMLKNSIEEISALAQYLQNTNEYLANVRALNEKLDLNENRTRTIEEMGTFFKNEIENIEQRGYAMANAVTKVNDCLQPALDSLMENTQSQLDKFNMIFAKQQDALQHQTDEMDTIVLGLKNLPAVNEAISKLECATNEQNHKIDDLANSIKKLARIKTGVVANNSWELIPKWAKISVISGFGVIVCSCLIMACATVFGGSKKEKTVQVEVPAERTPVINDIVPIDSLTVDSTKQNNF